MQILKESVKNNILNAAAEEFNEHGFENASIRRIAAKAGITPGNTYRYFKNKESILQAVVQPIFTEINQALLDSTDGKLGFVIGQENPFGGNPTFNVDIQKFSVRFVEINEQHRNGMSLLVKDKNYREQIKHWLTVSLNTYFLGKNKEAAPEYIKIMSSIAAVALMDAVTECLHFEEECRRMNIKESDIVNQCISAIIGKEEVML